MTALELRRECEHNLKMTERERWTSNVKCDDCGARATVVISEQDHPYETGSMGRRIETCPPGFQVVLSSGDGAEEPSIICANCKTLVFGPKQQAG